jgi:CBS domain-containing protein
MSTAREVMHRGAECVKENESLAQAAKMMRDLHVGSLPICGNDERLQGIITDRDIVVRCLAEGKDPKTVTASELAQGTPIWVDINADEEEILTLMIESRIRRLPVIEDRRLVGMISESDLARHLDDRQLAQFASAVYSAPPNS